METEKIYNELIELIDSYNCSSYLNPNCSVLNFFDLELDYPEEVMNLINLIRKTNKIHYNKGLWYSEDQELKILSYLNRYEEILKNKEVVIKNNKDKNIFINEYDIDGYDAYKNINLIIGSNNEDEIAEVIRTSYGIFEYYRKEISEKIASGEIKIFFNTEELKNNFLEYFMTLFLARNRDEQFEEVFDFIKKICHGKILNTKEEKTLCLINRN